MSKPRQPRLHFDPRLRQQLIADFGEADWHERQADSQRVADAIFVEYGFASRNGDDWSNFLLRLKEDARAISFALRLVPSITSFPVFNIVLRVLVGSRVPYDGRILVDLWHQIGDDYRRGIIAYVAATSKPLHLDKWLAELAIDPTVIYPKADILRACVKHLEKSDARQCLLANLPALPAFVAGLLPRVAQPNDAELLEANVSDAGPKDAAKMRKAADRIRSKFANK